MLAEEGDKLKILLKIIQYFSTGMVIEATLSLYYLGIALILISVILFILTTGFLLKYVEKIEAERRKNGNTGSH